MNNTWVKVLEVLDKLNLPQEKSRSVVSSKLSSTEEESNNRSFVLTGPTFDNL